MSSLMTAGYLPIAEYTAGENDVLRLTERQHAELRRHLFPGDGKEAVAVALCGRALGPRTGASGRRALIVHRVVPVAYDACTIRTRERVRWSTATLVPLLEEAARRGLGILKIHSHPGDYRAFSAVDDRADRELFPCVASWVGHDLNASAVMLPAGEIFARVVDSDGGFHVVPTVQVTGVDLTLWYADELLSSQEQATISIDPALNAQPAARGRAPAERETAANDATLRTEQAFGSGTLRRLGRLSVAVVGASGTGSPTIEMLARLSVGELVLVDGQSVEHKNRGRILHSLPSHADRGVPKVEVLAEAVRAMGLGTRVTAIPHSLWHPDVVRRVSQVDVIFGCMDSYDGRDLLNRLAAYYGIPYFDVGVRLDADGSGGVEQICGTVHYLQPDGSSLVSRGAIARDDIRAASMRRREPAAYGDLVQAKYLRGVREDRPAVISVNMLFAALALNELLARLHGYRDDGNAGFASFGLSLTQGRIISDIDGSPCEALAKKVGRGDARPLLDVPELSLAAKSLGLTASA